jgi:ComF family protein
MMAGVDVMGVAGRFGQFILSTGAVVAEAAGAWADAVFPPRCLGCGRTGSNFCPRCISTLKPVWPPWCASCGRSVPAGEVCADCYLDRLPLTGVRSAAAFEGPLRAAIHGLKYRGRTTAGRTLAALLVDPAASLDLGRRDEVLVAPVPLHQQRQRERGYNQAALLARPLAAALRLPYRAALLARVRPTAPQVGLSRPARRVNVRGAFQAAGVSSVRVLLVDDVVSTGSTLASAAQACLDAGAREVFGVTLARQN